jgi:hypothetical protein
MTYQLISNVSPQNVSASNVFQAERNSDEAEWLKANHGQFDLDEFEQSVLATLPLV